VRASVGDVALHYEVAGDSGPPLILLHGGPGADHTLFKPEFSALADACRVVYLDQRGSGESDVGSPETWTWPRWADDVAAFCTALSLDRPVLVGVSSGGLVALTCAARHPGLVGGLVLDSPLGAPTSLDETLGVFEKRGGAAAREAARSYLTGDTTAEAQAAWAEHCLPLYGAPSTKPRRVNEDVLTHFRTGGCGSADATALLPQITCPTLILAGEHDPVSPAAAARRLAAQLTNARVTLEIAPGVGHGVLRQDPERAFGLVRRFLAS